MIPPSSGSIRETLVTTTGRRKVLLMLDHDDMAEALKLGSKQAAIEWFLGNQLFRAVFPEYHCVRKRAYPINAKASMTAQQIKKFCQDYDHLEQTIENIINQHGPDVEVTMCCVSARSSHARDKNKSAEKSAINLDAMSQEHIRKIINTETTNNTDNGIAVKVNGIANPKEKNIILWYATQKGIESTSSLAKLALKFKCKHQRRDRDRDDVWEKPLNPHDSERYAKAWESEAKRLIVEDELKKYLRDNSNPEDTHAVYYFDDKMNDFKTVIDGGVQIPPGVGSVAIQGVKFDCWDAFFNQPDHQNHCVFYKLSHTIARAELDAPQTYPASQVAVFPPPPPPQPDNGENSPICCCVS